MTDVMIVEILKNGGHIDQLYLAGVIYLWPGKISVPYSQFSSLRERGVIDLDTKHWQGNLAYSNNTRYDTYKLKENHE